MLQGCTIHIHININIGQALCLSRVIGLRFERAQSLGLRSIVTLAPPPKQRSGVFRLRPYYTLRCYFKKPNTAYIVRKKVFR